MAILRFVILLIVFWLRLLWLLLFLRILIFISLGILILLLVILFLVLLQPLLFLVMMRWRWLVVFRVVMIMPKRFKTQYDKYENRSSVPVSNPGDRIHILYGPMFDSAGHMYLVETGKEDLYDYIQSHADSVDIHVILKRFAQGDVSVLSRVQGAYGDFTQMPKTFADALNTLVAAEAYFNSLPVNVRARFDHNFKQFIASMDSPTFASDMGMEPPAPVPDEPVVPGQTGAAAPVQPASATSGATPPAAASAGSA